MNRALRPRPRSPVARSTSEISNSFVGHTSGQCVKPKNTRKGTPRTSRCVTVLPSCETSAKGPPTAEGLVSCPAGLSVRTSAATSTARPMKRPISGTISRSARLDMRLETELGSETPGQSGEHGVPKDRRAMPAPEQEAGTDQAEHGRSGHDQGPAARPPRLKPSLFRHHTHAPAVRSGAGDGNRTHDIQLGKLMVRVSPGLRWLR